jgi:hypothetical protein
MTCKTKWRGARKADERYGIILRHRIEVIAYASKKNHRITRRAPRGSTLPALTSVSLLFSLVDPHSLWVERATGVARRIGALLASGEERVRLKLESQRLMLRRRDGRVVEERRRAVGRRVVDRRWRRRRWRRRRERGRGVRGDRRICPLEKRVVYR